MYGARTSPWKDVSADTSTWTLATVAGSSRIIQTECQDDTAYIKAHAQIKPTQSLSASVLGLKDFKMILRVTAAQSALTPVDLEKPLVKDGDVDDVDVHLYRYMIGSLMYLIASRPDIMFVVCACARFQVTPKTSHLLAVKRIFRYLKGKPTLGLWYSRDSPFELVAYTNSDYARATLDRKSTTGGCQFLGNRLISWQCKKQTVVATSTTKAEYVAAASCCGQVKHIEYLMLNASPLSNAKRQLMHVKRDWDTKIPQSSGPPVKVGNEAVHKELGDRNKGLSLLLLA
ncbi:hypothetical protein Tco_0711087 [Tanacetum coccineum]